MKFASTLYMVSASALIVVSLSPSFISRIPSAILGYTIFGTLALGTIPAMAVLCRKKKEERH